MANAHRVVSTFGAALHGLKHLPAMQPSRIFLITRSNNQEFAFRTKVATHA